MIFTFIAIFSIIVAAAIIIQLLTAKNRQLTAKLKKFEEEKISLTKSADRENNLKDAQSLAHVGSYTYDVLNDTLEWSDELFHIYGIPKEQGAPSWQEGYKMIHPDDLPHLTVKIKEANTSKSLLQTEYRIIRNDGSVRNLLLFRNPVLNKEHEVVKYFGAILDITERKSSEYELRKLSRAVEQNPASIVITDINGKIEYVNPKFLELTGYSPDEVIGRNPRILQSGLTPSETYRDMWKSILNGKTWNGEYCNRKKNGDLYWEAAIIFPIMDESGKITHFIAIKEDITLKKKIENELWNNKKDLNHAQSVAHIGSWRLHGKSNELSWSDETYRIFGLPLGSTVNVDVFVDQIHPEDREFVKAKWCAALKNGTYDIEHRTLCSGEERWVREKAEFEFDEQGNFKGAFGIVQDVSELKHVEHEMRTSKQWLERIAETSPDIIFILDLLTNRNIYANRSVASILGYSQDEFKSLENITKMVIHTGDLENVDKFYGDMKSAKKGEIREVSHRVFHKDGSIRWMHVRATPFSWNKEGLLTEVIGIARDITEAQLAQQVKIESEERITTLLNSVNESIWLFSIDGTILISNKIAAERLGTTVQELIGKKWYTLIPQSVAKFRQEKINEVILTGRHIKFEDERAGIIFDHNFYPVHNTEGAITGIAVFSRDVTDRVRQENALIESERRFRQLADSMPQVVWTAEPDGTVDYYNSRAKELDGIYEEKPGIWRWEPVLHPDDVEPTVKTWNNAVQFRTTYEIAHRVRMKTGGFKWFLSRGLPIKDESGVVVKWYGTATDIHLQKEIETNQKIQEQKLESLLSELKRSNKDLEQFAYTASHDLQEPIRMIKSYAQLLELKHKQSLDNNAQDYLYFITEGASRMQQLVNDLLSYSRVTTTKQELELVNINLVLASVMEDLKFRIAEEDASIKFGILPSVKGDKTQLRQLFQNFIQNSLKFRSDKKPEIIIRCEKKKQEWLFSISDNGIGIDPQFFDKIFLIFQRLHNREKYSGTGVGLAICKKIIERHGGEVFVESELNKGTTFYFTLPFKGD